MTALVEPRRPAAPQADPPGVARTLDTLATTLILVLTVAVLYLAREIFVPIAIAVLLSFVLSPPVTLLRTLGLGKTLSVSLVVLATFLVAVGLGAVLAKQVSDLAKEAPRYQFTATQKIEGISNFATNSPLLKKLNTTIADLTRTGARPTKTDQAGRDANNQDAENANARSQSSKSQNAKPGQPNGNQPSSPASRLQPSVKPETPPGPVQVEVISPPPGVLAILQTAAGMAASPLATAAFVAIFIVFILMQREDLRNRFIRLVGSGDLQRTTLAMDDAARRLSRYFLAQALLNTAFGVVMSGALAILGVPSAILWGIVAIFMRFIPYVGSIGAALPPVLMAAVATSGWTLAIETALLFVVAEAFVGQVVEPLLYGRNTGISPIAVVISATFWTWLWGPVGLVLSTPLTVCVVVMGRHVDRLAFFDVLLGDAPPLSPEETFYQRMLAGDPSEISDHAEAFLKTRSLLDYCDAVAMKALLMAQIDVRRGVLEEARQTRIAAAMRDLVGDLADQDRDEPATADPPAALEEEAPLRRDDDLPNVEIDPAWQRENAVVCLAGRTPLDEAAANLLADLLGKHGIGARVEPPDRLTTNQLSHLAALDAKLVILSFLDADLSVAQARFAVRRLRRRVPDVPIVAAFWMAEEDEARAGALCADVRCETCVSNLPQAIKLCLQRAAGTEATASMRDPMPEPGKDAA